MDVVDVDIEEMIKDAKKINPNISVFTTSTLTKENINELINELIK